MILVQIRYEKLLFSTAESANSSYLHKQNNYNCYFWGFKTPCNVQICDRKLKILNIILKEKLKKKESDDTEWKDQDPALLEMLI